MGFYEEMQGVALIGFILAIGGMILFFIPGLQIVSLIVTITGILMMAPAQTWMQYTKFKK